MKILIISTQQDLHAAAVTWGLRVLGFEPIMWDWSRFPRWESSSFHLEQDGSAYANLTLGGLEQQTPFDIIWRRRHGSPMPTVASHASDHKIIKNESKAYLKAISPLLGHSASRWVNPEVAARRADNKLFQLMIARDIGFAIPATLVSNEPAAIQGFFSQHGGAIIHKAFEPGGWELEDGSGIAVLKTAAVMEQHLVCHKVIRACPGIFQQKIIPDYELRVTVMGDTVLAGKIDSQKNGPSVDWRYDTADLGAVALSAVQLPQTVVDRCRLLCRRLGLEFGCIDLIMSRTGELYFIEINQTGQFLWKEEADPELFMLDAFCRFMAGDAACANQRLRFNDFKASASYATFKQLPEEVSNDEPFLTKEFPKAG